MIGSKTDDPRPSAGGKRNLKGVALFTAAGWLAVGLLVADRMHTTDMTSSLHNALVRSQTERHALSQELDRMSTEVEALQKRLSLYQKRETQAAANP